MNFKAITALLAIALLFAGCTQYGAGGANQQTQATLSTAASGASYTIELTANGFSPNPLTIKAGDTVSFVNKDSAPHWIASAPHPAHTLYPETGGCIGSKFDACKGLSQGETFTFTFTQKGEWAYHDHLNVTAPLFGKIIVQ